MPSLRSILLFATTALVAFSSASPVHEASVARDVNASNGIQTLEAIFSNAKMQLSDVQAQVSQITTNNQSATVDTVRPQIDAVNEILTKTLASVQPLSRQALLFPGGNNTAFLQQLASFITTVASIISSIINAVGGGATSSGQSVTRIAASTVGISLGQILFVVLKLVGAILPPLIPLLVGVLPTLFALGLGPLLGIVI